MSKKIDAHRNSLGLFSGVLAQERNRKRYGLKLGYQKAAFDDSKWGAIEVPGSWGEQGHRQKNGTSYHGPAWYRKTVSVPTDWKGFPLQLQLGQPNQRGVGRCTRSPGRSLPSSLRCGYQTGCDWACVSAA